MIGLTKHVFIRYHHEIPIVDLERDAQGGVRRPRKRRAPIETRHQLGLAHVVDIENDQTALPVTRIKPIAVAQRVMAFVRIALPRRRLATGDPLSGHPPAADFFGFGRIFQIENHHDVAEVAIHRRRDVSVTPVKIEAVHTACVLRIGAVGGFPMRNEGGFFRL